MTNHNHPKKTSKRLNFFYYSLLASTLYTLLFAGFFLEQHRAAFFSVFGGLVAVGTIVGWQYLSNKRGLSKAMGSIALLLVYSIAWGIFVIFLLVYELGFAVQAIENRQTYFNQDIGLKLLFFAKISPLPVLLFNLVNLRLIL